MRRAYIYKKVAKDAVKIRLSEVVITMLKQTRLLRFRFMYNFLFCYLFLHVYVI